VGTSGSITLQAERGNNTICLSNFSDLRRKVINEMPRDLIAARRRTVKTLAGI
jgi:hypothetical protein